VNTYVISSGDLPPTQDWLSTARSIRAGPAVEKQIAQQVIGRALIKFIVAMVALVSSFLGVRSLLDYVDDARFDLASHRPVIFSMRVDNSSRNWHAATSDTKVAVSGDRILINSSAPPGHYEVIFGPFTTKSGARYKVSYDVASTNGGLAIAMQSNTPPATVIRTKLVTQPREAFTFKAISEITQLELINSSQLPTTATVNSVVVTEAD